MDPKELEFALASRRFFQGAQWLSRLPGPQVRLSRRWGRLASPYVADRALLELSYIQAFGASAQLAKDLTNQWLASHGLFARSIFSYQHMSPKWVKQKVQIDQPEALQSLQSQGGLVLSYHSHHHNTLGIVLGQSGVTTWGVAATEKASPMAPYTGKFMRIINGDSEAKFGGGKYLFTDEPRNLLRGLKHAFASQHAVVSICDNPSPIEDEAPVFFRGKQFHVGAGVVAMALEHQVPITLAILYPTLLGGYELKLMQLKNCTTVSEVLQSYFDFLADIVLHTPWAWQGFHWFSGLPQATRLRGDILKSE
jgi:lauroyl/myristoyl acyltransferase